VGAIRNDGAWLIKDVRSDDSYAENLENPLAALTYGFSVLYCPSSAMSKPGGAGWAHWESRHGCAGVWGGMPVLIVSEISISTTTRSTTIRGCANNGTVPRETRMKNEQRYIFGIILLLPLGLFAQEFSGAISGKVMGPFDGLVTNAPIQLVHSSSGDAWRSRTDAEGRYEFKGLPSGDYTLRVRTRCCEYRPYDSETLTLDATTVRDFDVQLQQGFQLNTIGDDQGIATSQVLASREVPDLPMPRHPDGQPNLTGMWVYGSDPFAPDPKFHPWAAELVAKREANNFIDSPRIRCLPTDLPIPGHTPPTFGKFVHIPGLVVILYEGVLGYRQIFTDGRKHPDYPNPTWLGHSIGWWEGNTLVVDTSGFNDRGWTGLTHPRSEQFHVIERYTRTSYGDMELELTIEDPVVYTESRTEQIPVYLTPQEELLEFVCENDKWVQPAAD
jgi:hypothetical protein